MHTGYQERECVIRQRRAVTHHSCTAKSLAPEDRQGSACEQSTLLVPSTPLLLEWSPGPLLRTRLVHEDTQETCYRPGPDPRDTNRRQGSTEGVAALLRAIHPPATAQERRSEGNDSPCRQSKNLPPALRDAMALPKLLKSPVIRDYQRLTWKWTDYQKRFQKSFPFPRTVLLEELLEGTPASVST